MQPLYHGCVHDSREVYAAPNIYDSREVRCSQHWDWHGDIAILNSWGQAVLAVHCALRLRVRVRVRVRVKVMYA